MEGKKKLHSSNWLLCNCNFDYLFFSDYFLALSHCNCLQTGQNVFVSIVFVSDYHVNEASMMWCDRLKMFQ